MEGREHVSFFGGCIVLSTYILVRHTFVYSREFKQYYPLGAMIVFQDEIEPPNDTQWKVLNTQHAIDWSGVHEDSRSKLV